MLLPSPLFLLSYLLATDQNADRTTTGIGGRDGGGSSLTRRPKRGRGSGRGGRGYGSGRSMDVPWEGRDILVKEQRRQTHY